MPDPNRTDPIARARVGVMAIGLMAAFAWGGAYAAANADPAPPTGQPASSAALLAAAKAPTALAALDTLQVKGRAPMTGYQRTDDFGSAWLDVDRNGCDTRDDILRRDLTHPVGTRCKVTSGVLQDPYTGHRIAFTRGVRTSTAVQIDHVVALGNAWVSGAQRWTQAKRVALANDPINLFAVDGPTNEQKSDSNAASWLPPKKSFRCEYVAHQVGVKKAYGLSVTSSEKAAMERVLTACPTITIPTSKTVHLVYTGPGAGKGPQPSASPSPSATPTASTSSAPVESTAPPAGDQGVVHPGSYCTPDGATGHTDKGTPMVCRTTSTDSRDRWRSAA